MRTHDTHTCGHVEPKIRKGLELQTEPFSVYIDLSTISADDAFVLTDCIPSLHASFDS